MHLAIVVARYGKEVVGGVERLARRLAESICAETTWQVTVLTSCAMRQDRWENHYQPGVTALNGVTVRRFPVTPFDTSERDRLNKRLARNHKLVSSEQYEWVQAGEQCEALYAWLARHSAEFSHIITLPYLSTVAYNAGWIAPAKTLVWPCLHDEIYAFLEPFRLLMESAQGLLFNSPEEAAFTLDVVGIRPKQHALLGVGVELAITDARENQRQSAPYLLFLGRLVAGKNLHLLYDYAQRFWEDYGTVQLAVVGRGGLQPPEHPAFIFHGAVDEPTKAALVTGALAVCQPSLNESFSLVMMEAWLANRPALVHADAAVTVGHLQRARAGLAFRTYAEYCAAVEWLLAHPTKATQMGQNGRRYVEANYRWSHVVARLVTTLTTWQKESNAS